jgi:S1-C subfamily serine protease
MRRHILILFCLCAFSNSFHVYAQSKKAVNTGQRQSGDALTARQIASKALRSVVLIVTTDEEGNPIGQGSGFVFRSGLVVTNLHVFTRATKAVIKSIANGKSYTALEVLGMSLKHDLCVIRINDDPCTLCHLQGQKPHKSVTKFMLLVILKDLKGP